MPARVPDPHAAHRSARRLALAALFEAEFGQRTAAAALERQLSELQVDDASAAYARSLVEAVVRYRDSIDARIEASAPAYPVVQLARIDRALLRSALGELLHSAATPARVVIAEWVGLARTYSGEPARRLVNGVLGRIADETGLAAPAPGAGDRGSRRPRSGGTGPP
ncbi:MAG TPA: transcription antitermination factor NusB [Candidatus Acidoferrales bacterium]|nr:transcription antitermination factor NusB [Candidatus Acidoferrales bacterium]